MIPAAATEDARQLLKDPTADSIHTRYVTLSTFFFGFFETISEDPLQLVVGKVFNVVVLPGFVGLGARRNIASLECQLAMAMVQIDSLGLRNSGHRLLH
jgi:hypothetical protein